MSEKPISPLRQRMLEDMVMRGLHHDTQRDYVRSVRSFAAFLKRHRRGMQITVHPERVTRIRMVDPAAQRD